jgi:hypothetical protein
MYTHIVAHAPVVTLTCTLSSLTVSRAGRLQREVEEQQRRHKLALEAQLKEEEENLKNRGTLDNAAAKVDAATMEERVRGNRFYSQRNADASNFMKR